MEYTPAGSPPDTPHTQDLTLAHHSAYPAQPSHYRGRRGYGHISPGGRPTAATFRQTAGRRSHISPDRFSWARTVSSNPRRILRQRERQTQQARQTRRNDDRQSIGSGGN